MKKYIAVLLIIMMSVMLICGCDGTDYKGDDDKLKVIATIFPQYDFARRIAGDKAEVEMLITPGAESHGFEPTTSDMIKISECDIFIYTGGESDGWIESMISSVNNPNMRVISLIDCIEDKITTEHTDDADGHTHTETDEHIWTSPVNCLAIVESICIEMCRADKENAQVYNQNKAELISELEGLDRDFREIIENSECHELVFGDRFPLYYFAREYGLEYYAAFSGCSDDTEASAATIAALIDRVKSDNIPVVFKIELSSDAIASAISAETGAEVKTFYTCHNISKEDFENSETYISMMKRNLESLKVALSRK